uniref:Uncharacterized protein n=1 Tax=Oryza rufipogon TaxID=4529 RepID=A0A0E0NWZ4_ORYRU
MDKQTPQPSKGSMAGSGSRWLEKGRSIKAARRQGRPGEELRTEDRAKDIGVDHVSGEELRASRDNPDNCDNHLQLHHQRRDDRCHLAPQQPLPPRPDALLTSGAGCSRNPRDRAASASCRSTSPPPVPDLATAVPDLPLPSLEASPPSLPDAGKCHFPTRCGKACRCIPG